MTLRVFFLQGSTVPSAHLRWLFIYIIFKNILFCFWGNSLFPILFFLQVSVLSWLFMYFQRIVLLISERNTGLEKWFYLSLWLLLLLYVLYACVDNKHIGMLTSACVCTCRSEFDMKMSSLIIWTHQFF